MNNMSLFLNAFSFRKLVPFFSRFLLKHFRKPKIFYKHLTISQFGFQKFQFLAQRSDLEDHFLIFNVETALLKSSSLFPYFMLVAFEAGSLLRAFVLLVSYPFIRICSENFGLKIMVMVCFFGLKKESFRAGSAVLPKFFLENVGMESFEVLKRGKKKVAVSNLPQVMVESFLRDYLNIDFVFGRELKVFGGYFLGLMEEKREFVLEKNAFEVGKITSDLIGVSSLKKSFDSQWFSYCKEIYLVSEGDSRHWNQLPRNLYPKPLIFHDGRLAFRPSFLATLSMFMWLPVGCILSIIRSITALSLPYNIAIPIVAFTGVQLRLKNVPKRRFEANLENNKTQAGLLYVTNHRTLLDALMISYGLKTPLTAVTYSLSRMSELLSPIKTVRLARDRNQDAMLMKKMLSQGDLVVCPEGTTCRESYLLRFSPLFSQLAGDIDHYILPVAMDSHVSMFYGTTAGGYKCLDPLFFLMNPQPTYTLQFLHKVSGVAANSDHAEKSKFDVANSIQNEIAKVLGFTCTTLTRKDKYLILAGNEGIVRDGNTR
ncbi:putative glycerol-3-phosphate acyltransferase 3 [Abeliophyllum distichum]|uniref:Glycerol-3-phosphate acyltransferase 3 n=1 Tax=Abeliophyllum distichum TaxID=126358 RepID=A0ABD1R0E8_9LAMI